MAMVVTPMVMRKVNRCPICRRLSPREQERCSCGYEFDQMLMLLHEQRTSDCTALVGLIIAEIILLALMLAFVTTATILILTGGVAIGGVAIVRLLRRLALTRERLSLLENKKRLHDGLPMLPAPLPEAVALATRTRD